MTTDHPDIIQLDRTVSEVFADAERLELEATTTGADWLKVYGQQRHDLARAKAANR